jgi:hypothetical protein
LSYTPLQMRRSRQLMKFCISRFNRVSTIYPFPLRLASCVNLTGTGFLLFCFTVLVFAIVMIYRVAPRYGKQNPLIYLSICSTVGSVSVMSVKAFGIAVKLTFAGNNQFSHPSTYVFIILTTVCILTQMNYFNKALSQFPTSMYVNPTE